MLHTDRRLLPYPTGMPRSAGMPDPAGTRDPAETHDPAETPHLPGTGHTLHLACAVDALPAALPGATGRMRMEVIGQAGERRACLELVLRPETVEVWHRYRCCVITGRDGLRRWFRGCAPTPLVTDEVTWSRGGKDDGMTAAATGTPAMVCVEVDGLLARVALPEAVTRRLNETL